MKYSAFYTGDGANAQFDVTFAYNVKDDVYAEVDGVAVAFTWVSATRIELSSAPANGSEVRIGRRTNIDDPSVVFNDDTVLVGKDMNKARDQVLHSSQELWDEFDRADLDRRSLEARAIRFADGQDTAELDRTAFSGKFMLVNGDGQVIPSSGTGADAGLRDDLLASTGLTLVRASNGMTAQKLLDRTPRALSYGVRAPARTTREALAVAAAMPSYLVGYAADAGTTGGQAAPTYYVDSPYTDASIPNSFGWALAKAKVGGGTIVFDPRHKLDILILDDLLMRFNAGQDNITMVAPGRNVTLWFSPLTSGALVQSKNMIFAWIEFRTFGGSLSADTYGIAGKVEHKLMSVSPQLADKLAFVGCEFRHSSDGALDMSATTLTEASPTCRVTVQDCILWDTDQAMLLGANDVSADLSSTIKLFVTLYNVVYAYCGERQPKVLGRTFVDMVNVYTLMLPFRRDNAAPVGEYSVCYGTEVALGGKLRARGCLWALAAGDLTYVATGVLEGYVGAITAVDCAGEGNVTFEEKDPGLIPVPPYVLAHDPVPAGGAVREAWIDDRWYAAGARADAAPSGLFVWDADSTAYPNGETVLVERSSSGVIPGRYIRTDRPVEAPKVTVPRSGSYVPTVTGVTNYASHSNLNAFWQRSENGDYITVEGTIDLVSTIAGDTTIKLSLPVASDLSASSDLTGAMVCYRGANITGGAIIGSPADNLALLRPFTGSTASLTYTFRFTYKVKP